MFSWGSISRTASSSSIKCGSNCIGMPKLEQFEIKKYWQIFSGLKPIDNKVTHDQVLPILYNAKLDSSILNKVWFLADIDDDDNLDFEEFVICMRLIFDMVNKNIDKIPDELPEWLVPGSKAKLVKERQQTNQQENADIPKVETTQVDWYISPKDKELYNDILNTVTTSTDGTYSFPSITLVLKSKLFNIGTSDLNKAWNLVNPKNLASIDRDPAVFFTHMLRQCNDIGAVIPSELPKALADICRKERITYDLRSDNNEVKRTSATNTRTTKTFQTDWKPIKVADIPRGSINDEASLQKELNALNIELNHVKDEVSKQQNTSLVKQQFEELLKYKEQQYQRSRQAENSNTPINIRSVRDDLTSIEQQVEVLESYLNDKRLEMNELQSQIQSYNN